MSDMMQPVSNLISNAAQPSAAAGAGEAPRIHRAKAQAPARSQRPAMDKYAPEEKQQPSGRYWLGRDKDGQPKVYFDNPEQAAGHPQSPGQFPCACDPERDGKAAGPEKEAAGSRKAGICRGSTDKVDREIEALKKKREELEQKISAETDSAKVRELERKLAQVERELRQKDNDTYRRRHTVFS